MADYREALLSQAREKASELAQHPVLARYWSRISLVLTGSTARGNADQYSDIDLVFYASEADKAAIVGDYVAQGLSQRPDGVFIFFPNGHYHVETYEALRDTFAQRAFIACWELANVLVLSDPSGAFAQIVAAGQRELFAPHLEILKRAYLDLQLDLDWMRMPIARGDALATFLHAAKIVQGLCRAAYLLEARSYPPDKWIGFYLPSTAWGRANGAAVREVLLTCEQLHTLAPDQPFGEHPLYKELAALIDTVGAAIAAAHGEQAWLARWYDFV